MRLSHLACSRGYWFAVAAGVIVALPLLGFGLFVDDYLFLATLSGQNPLGSPFDLFVFGSGDADQVMPLIEDGPYPWFGDPEFRVHFFRPLGSALMSLDHAVFGHCAFGYNAHSLLWYGLLCLSAMLVFRRVLPPAMGVLALLLFVVDASHVLPAAWWSNRHSVVAVAMGLLGLTAHLRWRCEGWRPGLPLSLMLYVAALLASETGLCVLAYLAAYEIFGARDGWRRRLLSAAPASLLAIAYVAFYRLSGYGAQYSDIYIDPLGDPVAFLLAAPARFLMLAGAQFFLLPVEAALLRSGLEPLFVVSGGIGLAVIAATLYMLWPRFDVEERAALRWLIPGAALATTPALAAIVNSRVLLAASLGGAAMIAAIISRLWRELGAMPRTLFHTLALRALLWFLIVAHLGVSVLSWPAQVAALRTGQDFLNRLIHNSEIDESGVTETQVVVFNAPDPYSGLYPLMLRSFHGKPLPRSWWTLSFAPFEHRITRTGEQELELEVLAGEMLTSVMERLFRSARRPLNVGYEMELNGLRVTVLDMGDKGPARIRLTFAEPPESARYQLLVFRDGAYRRFDPPPPGQSIVLPRGFRRSVKNQQTPG